MSIIYEYQRKFYFHSGVIKFLINKLIENFVRWLILYLRVRNGNNNLFLKELLSKFIYHIIQIKFFNCK